MTIELSVHEYRLVRHSDTKPATGNVNHLRLHLSIDGWDGYPIRGVCIKSPCNGDFVVYLDENDSCTVPADAMEKPGHIYITAFGKSPDLKSRITTNMVSVYVNASLYQ